MLKTHFLHSFHSDSETLVFLPDFFQGQYYGCTEYILCISIHPFKDLIFLKIHDYVEWYAEIFILCNRVALLSSKYSLTYSKLKITGSCYLNDSFIQKLSLTYTLGFMCTHEVCEGWNECCRHQLLNQHTHTHTHTHAHSSHTRTCTC